MDEKQIELFEKFCERYDIQLTPSQRLQVLSIIEKTKEEALTIPMYHPYRPLYLNGILAMMRCGISILKPNEVVVVVGRGNAKSFATFKQLTGIDLNEV